MARRAKSALRISRAGSICGWWRAGLALLAAACGGDSTTGPNQGPSVEIYAPAAQTQYALGTTIIFAGEGFDPEDGDLPVTSLVWKADDGTQLGTGEATTVSNLAAGTRTVSLIGTDSDGAADTARVTIVVYEPNTAPTVQILSPEHSSVFTVGNAITFTGSGADPQDGPLDGESLVWSTADGTVLGTGPALTTETLAAARHFVSLVGTDSRGAADTATVAVHVCWTPTITAGGVVEGAITADDGYDYFSGARSDHFQFAVESAGTYEITMRSQDVDSYLVLWPQALSRLWFDDNGGAGATGLDARIVTSLQAGCYTAAATTSGDMLGAYTLTLTRLGGG